MASGSIRTVTLEIDVGSDPITGRLRGRSKSEQEQFVGWLGLAKALERLLRPESPRRSRRSAT